MSDIWKSTNRLAWMLLKAIALLLIVSGIGYWVKFAPLPVVSHTVERGTITAEAMGTGTLEALVQTTISPKFSGRIVEVLVDQGTRVASGDLWGNSTTRSYSNRSPSRLSLRCCRCWSSKGFESEPLKASRLPTNRNHITRALSLAE